MLTTYTHVKHIVTQTYHSVICVRGISNKLKFILGTLILYIFYKKRLIKCKLKIEKE